MGQAIVNPSWVGRTFRPIVKDDRRYPCAFTIRIAGEYTFRVAWSDGAEPPDRKETMSIGVFMVHKDKLFREVH